MKLFVKTLKGTHFEIEVNPSDTVADLKKGIETMHGPEVYPAAQQMLIYQGKVLSDLTTIEANQVVDKSFVVIMLTKNKATPVGASTTSSAPASLAPPTSSPYATQPLTTPQAPRSTAPESIPAATPPTAPPAPPGSDVYGQAASNRVAGNNVEVMIQQLLDMGGGSWDRDTVSRALRAAFNNPERAVDYLYSGIPEQDDVPPVVLPPSSGQAANPLSQPAPAPTPAPLAPSSGPNANPLDLFPQGLPNVGSDVGAGTLDALRNSQQFEVLQRMVQTSPQLLQPMLQELGKQNPQLRRLIQDNQGDFLRMINEPLEEGNISDELLAAPPQLPLMTPEDRAAVERLESMGFNRAMVVEVFIACNKNEELAANYLLDHGHEFED